MEAEIQRAPSYEKSRLRNKLASNKRSLDSTMARMQQITRQMDDMDVSSVCVAGSQSVYLPTCMIRDIACSCLNAQVMIVSSIYEKWLEGNMFYITKPDFWSV